jgi:hypothetical protein
MIAYVGRAYCKEHTIPVVKTVAPFLRDFPFHIHSRLPINAVQFTILSIIAMGYKPAVAHFGSEVSSIFLANFDYATIDKTLFYVNLNSVLTTKKNDILNFWTLIFVD